jgi:hypothetical protein
MIGAITAGLFSTGAAPAAATSFDSIATSTGGGASITFSSIPSTYKNLQIRGIASTGAGGYIKVTFNGDTGANYSWHEIYANGSTVTAAGGGSKNFIIADEVLTATASVYGAFVMDILDYTNTNKNKTLRNLGGQDSNGSGYVVPTSGAWYNTAAITSITITPVSGSFASNTNIALYGIKG